MSQISENEAKALVAELPLSIEELTKLQTAIREALDKAWNQGFEDCEMKHMLDHLVYK